jgi:hypothetical protein
MARLPNPGGDEGTWGNVLNEFLNTIHNTDGTLKDNVVSSSALAPDAVDSANIQDATISEDKLDAALAAKVNTVSSGAPDATTSTKGLVQLAGDLGGTATTPTVPGLATKVTANTAIVGATKTKITYGTNGLVTAGADATQDDIGDGTTFKQYSATEKTKLAGIATGATVNSPDATLLNRANHTGTQPASTISDFSTAADARITAATGTSVQGYDADLAAIGALAPVNDDLLQRKSGAWTNRTPVQVKADLALTKADVGLSNVDNTSDLDKPISTDTQTALDAKADNAAIGAKVLLIDNAAALPPGTPAGVVVVVKS